MFESCFSKYTPRQTFDWHLCLDTLHISWELCLGSLAEGVWKRVLGNLFRGSLFQRNLLGNLVLELCLILRILLRNLLEPLPRILWETFGNQAWEPLGTLAIRILATLTCSGTEKPCLKARRLCLGEKTHAHKNASRSHLHVAYGNEMILLRYIPSIP